MRRHGGGMAILAGLLVLAGACGGDDGEAADEDAPAGGGAVVDGGDAASGGSCAGTDLTFTNKETGASVTVTSTAAVSLVGGAAYTAYAADFEIDPEAITFLASPEVPEDGNLLTLAVTIFNAEEEPEPLEAGTEVVHDSSRFGVLTFVVTHTAGETLHGNNTDGEGTLLLTAVGDRFCAELDYQDAQKELSGTIEATVKPLS